MMEKARGKRHPEELLTMTSETYTEKIKRHNKSMIERDDIQHTHTYTHMIHITKT